jgi:hypothetical protein
MSSGTAGSTRFDDLSIRWNNEARRNICDAAFAAKPVKGDRGGPGRVESSTPGWGEHPIASASDSRLFFVLWQPRNNGQATPASGTPGTDTGTTNNSYEKNDPKPAKQRISEQYTAIGPTRVSPGSGPTEFSAARRNPGEDPDGFRATPIPSSGGKKQPEAGAQPMSCDPVLVPGWTKQLLKIWHNQNWQRKQLRAGV